MNTKRTLSIVAFFSCASLFCTGFANWVIVQRETHIQGTVSAENVALLFEEGVLRRGTASEFRYCEDGFLQPSGVNGRYELAPDAEGRTVGSAEHTFTVDLQRFEEKYGYMPVSLDFIVTAVRTGAQTPDLFTLLEDRPEALTASYSALGITADFSPEARSSSAGSVTYALRLMWEDARTEIDVAIRYTLSLTTEEFSTYFYAPYAADEAGIDLEITLQGHKS